MAKFVRATYALGLALGCASSAAEGLADCRGIADDRERLACYDRLAVPAGPHPGPLPQAGEGEKATKPAAPAPVPVVPAAAQSGSLLSRFWELDPEHKRGTFRVTGYRPNIFLPVHYTNRLNRRPTSPSRDHSGELEHYRALETKLQISLRTKIFEDVGLPGGDLWFGYTQQSLWQLWNRALSTPFRSNDYEPELIYVVPVPESLGSGPGDWRLAMVQAGVAHQSNGLALPLSRSWNRIIVGAGVERGGLSILGRLWHRLEEDPQDDDNPDLTAYRGRGDLQFVWPMGKANLSLLWRTNLRNIDRGAVQLDWTYPVIRSRPDGLRWYVQLFSGYGETLLDYNFRQTSIGLGVTLFDF